jgi:RNA polymerase sigma factor (sigma-70 family)
MEQSRARLGEVFGREKERLLRFVEKQLFGGSDGEAEDIVSDVAYNLLRRADVVGEIENLTAYIYRSLTNRVMDRGRQGVPTLSLDAVREEGETAFDVEDERPGPQLAVLQAELRQQLVDAIGKLGPQERAVWLATEIDGRSFRDLAEEWDEPIGTLLSRKSRATAKLRELLSEYKDFDRR